MTTIRLCFGAVKICCFHAPGHNQEKFLRLYFEKVGYESVSATVNSVVSGILVILFATRELITDRDFSAWWYDHRHHPVAYELIGRVVA
jgi:hypothetical protein